MPQPCHSVPDVAKLRESKMALESEGNRALIQSWIAKWEPLADRAIDAYCSQLPDVAEAAASAKAATRNFRQSLGL